MSKAEGSSAKSVAILGAGQLARMLITAGTSLGIEFFCQDPAKEVCANNTIHPPIQADYNDFSAIDQLLSQCEYVTFENENIPLTTADYIHQKNKLFPGPLALYHSQDRLMEKQFFQSLHIPTAPFHPVDNKSSFKEAVVKLGLPLILKTRRFGYDGKGQYWVHTEEEGLKIVETTTTPLIAEAVVSFQNELSIIAARNSWETVFYPLVKNYHYQGILRLSKPCSQHPLQNAAEKIITSVLEALDYRGVLAIELFETPQGLCVNEMAPRVHNTGHWTIEGAHTSQFENHLRGVCDLPLGRTELKGYSLMINAIGAFPALNDLLRIPFCHSHNYQKQPRPLRKVGHVTLNHPDPEYLNRLLLEHPVLKNMVEGNYVSML